MVKTRTRLLLALLLSFGLGLYEIINWIQDDLRPHYLMSMEESMIDMATVLASHVSNQVSDEEIPVHDLRAAFDTAAKRQFSATIYKITKTRINMRVYITDHTGLVLFDSEGGKDEGMDYSQWNDVIRTLRGEYGARASRTDPDDPMTSLLTVAAPIKSGEEIVGVLAVCKPTESVRQFLELAGDNIWMLGLNAALVLVLIAVVTSFWITWPIEKLTRYVRAVRDGKRVALPSLGWNEIGTLGKAFEEMRVALEGRQYVEEYVQTLTHQMKSPLSAIRGAAELLEEDMTPDQQRQFIRNIQSESARIQDLVDRMLLLSALENRKELLDVETVPINDLLAKIVEGMQPVFAAKHLHVHLAPAAAATVTCERFLVRQAVINLLQNAVDFCGDSGSITVATRVHDEHVDIVIEDNGQAIPEYALTKVFDRFYSLQRHDTGKKSSGLGLAFVKEVATLHHGEATLENRPEGGVRAVLSLPMNAASPGL
jgi:two-component system, OmpR family, sensor histidine kinase CreC